VAVEDKAHRYCRVPQRLDVGKIATRVALNLRAVGILNPGPAIFCLQKKSLPVYGRRYTKTWKDVSGWVKAWNCCGALYSFCLGRTIAKTL